MTVKGDLLAVAGVGNGVGTPLGLPDQSLVGGSQQLSERGDGLEGQQGSCVPVEQPQYRFVEVHAHPGVLDSPQLVQVIESPLPETVVLEVGGDLFEELAVEVVMVELDGVEESGEGGNERRLGQ